MKRFNINQQITEAVLQRLLRESEPDLGDIEFSPNRKDGVPRNEPNTAAEAKIEKALNDYVNFNLQPDQDSVELLRSLLSSNKYNKYFTTPTQTIYRGVSKIDPETLELWLGHPIPDDQQEGEEQSNYTLNPRGLSTITSWSPDIETAEGFARWDENNEEGLYSVIFTASPTDNPNTLLNLDNILNTVDWSQPMDEGEIIALGPVTINTISWRRN